MRIDSMELLGVCVEDFDGALSSFSALFGLDFRVFTPGVDYEIVDLDADVEDRQPPAAGRIALDTSGCFELVEMPGEHEGVRNIHFRVDDIDAALAHARSNGLRAVRDLRIGAVREVVFDSSALYGIRLCFLQYEGDSLAEAFSAAAPAAPPM